MERQSAYQYPGNNSVIFHIHRLKSVRVVDYVIKFSRVWAMPNRETFKIKPIKELLSRYVGDGKGWVDPFAGDNSPAEYTNDLNQKTKAKSHLHWEDFIKTTPLEINGLLLDPPYSLRQMEECYDKIDKKMTFDESKDASYSRLKNKCKNNIITKGFAINFGWSTVGFGKKRGFEIIEILDVCHGGHHNDTLVTVERKVQQNLNRK